MGQKLGRPALDVAAVGHQKETETPAELPKEHASQRLIIVGDVHGCADELQNLLAKVKFKKGSDVLILNGDIINKGPKSVQVIDQIRSLDGIVVRGNQDDKALAQYFQWKAGKPLEDAQKWLEDLGEERAEWLKQLPFSLSVPARKLIVVHAGLIPGIPLQQQSLKTLTELRNLPAPAHLADSSIPESHEKSSDQCESQHSSKSPQAEPASHSKSQGPQSVTGPGVECTEGEKQLPWASVWQGPEHVVFGHDAGRKLQAWPCATGLDTGCCYGGQLTALMIPAANNQGSGSAASLQADNAGMDKSDDTGTAEHSASHRTDSHLKQQAGKPGGTSGPPQSPAQLDGHMSEAAGQSQFDASAAVVPSLIDWDASFVLVPAKKAYSKKKLWPSMKV